MSSLKDKVKIEASYEIAVSIFNGELAFRDGAERLHAEQGINLNSAKDILYVFQHLRNGTKFKRTLSNAYFEFFLAKTYENQGAEGLRTALDAIWVHIEYYEKIAKLTRRSLRQIVVRFERMLGHQAKYIASVEVKSEYSIENSNQSLFLIDAVPVFEFNSFFIQQNYVELFPYLALQIEAPAGLFAGIEGGVSYFEITVTSEPQNGPEWVQAQLVLEDVEGELPRQFFVSTTTSPLSEAETEAIFRRLDSIFQNNLFSGNVKDYPSLSNFEADYNAIYGSVTYDVGQASMNALVDECGRPRLFFDFGKPINLYDKSGPGLVNFAPLHCSENAPVVISHADDDHWIYAIQSGVAKYKPPGVWATTPIYRAGVFDRYWIIRDPRPVVKIKFGFIHLMESLALTPMGGGSALISVTPVCLPLSIGGVEIFACTPATGSSTHPSFLLNNLSLGMTARNLDHKTKILFPGDACYSSIPYAYTSGTSDLTGLVATHHGGGGRAVMASAVPYPAAKDVSSITGRPVVQSFGTTTYPGMPSSTIDTQCISNGWVIHKTTTRSACSHSTSSACGHSTSSACSHSTSSACIQGHKFIPLQPSVSTSCACISHDCLCY